MTPETLAEKENRRDETDLTNFSHISIKFHALNYSAGKFYLKTWRNTVVHLVKINIIFFYYFFLNVLSPVTKYIALWRFSYAKKKKIKKSMCNKNMNKTKVQNSQHQQIIVKMTRL